MRTRWLWLAVLVVVALVALPMAAAAAYDTGPPGAVVSQASAVQAVEVDTGLVLDDQPGLAADVRRRAISLVVILTTALAGAAVGRLNKRSRVMRTPIGLTDGGWSLSSA